MIFCVSGTLLVLLATGILLPTAAQTQAPFSYTKNTELVKDAFRVTSKYIYKGEAVTIEFALACRGIKTNYRDGDRSFDIFGGPQMYGNVMADGKAVVISTRSFCHTFRNGVPNASMPENFLPITVIYDNPDTLGYGIAYMSDDAYENASSVMRFVEARVSSLNLLELEELLRRQKPNVVRSQTNRNVFDKANLSGMRPPIGTDCIGVARYPLADELKSEVLKHWPADHPKYWQPADEHEYSALKQLSMRHSQLRGRDFWVTHLSMGTGRAGLPRRDGGGSGANRFGYTFAQPMAEWYPVEHIVEPGALLRRYRIHAFDQSKRGLFYCSFVERNPDLPVSRLLQPVELAISGELVRNYVTALRDGPISSIWVEDREMLFRVLYSLADGLGEQNDDR